MYRKAKSKGRYTMGKFDGILLMSDFDGTLCHLGKTPYNVGKISKENCDAIRYFQAEGGLFSLVSGRSPQKLPEWKEYFVPNTWSAVFNGAILCDAEGKNPVFQAPVDADFADIVTAAVNVCPFFDSFYLYRYEDCAVVHRGEPFDSAALVQEMPAYKIVIRVPTELSDAYLQNVRGVVGDRYMTVRSWINGIEIQKKGTGKGDAVKRLKALLGDRVHTTVAVGDYENDIEMIQAADIGYAVENAVPLLKAVADRITVSCSENAIAHVIRDLDCR